MFGLILKWSWTAVQLVNLFAFTVMFAAVWQHQLERRHATAGSDEAWLFEQLSD